jgi:chemotaxis protein CheX
MPAVEEISESMIRENIARAVADVFKTMLGRPVVLAPERPDVPAAVTEAAQIVGSVGFIGEVNGLIYIHLTEAFATQVTGQILGMSKPELLAAGDETVNDAIGELTNMVVGSFKNALCDAGYPCKLTIPSILRGSNFCIQSTRSAQRRRYQFACGDQRLVADIILKAGD